MAPPAQKGSTLLLHRFLRLGGAGILAITCCYLAFGPSQLFSFLLSFLFCLLRQNKAPLWAGLGEFFWPVFTFYRSLCVCSARVLPFSFASPKEKGSQKEKSIFCQRLSVRTEFIRAGAGQKRALRWFPTAFFSWVALDL